MRVRSNIFNKPYKLQNRDRPIDLIFIQQLADIEHNLIAGIATGLNTGVMAFAYPQPLSRLGLSQLELAILIFSHYGRRLILRRFTPYDLVQQFHIILPVYALKTDPFWLMVLVVLKCDHCLSLFLKFKFKFNSVLLWNIAPFIRNTAIF